MASIESLDADKSDIPIAPEFRNDFEVRSYGRVDYMVAFAPPAVRGVLFDLLGGHRRSKPS